MWMVRCNPLALYIGKQLTPLDAMQDYRPAQTTQLNSYISFTAHYSTFDVPAFTVITLRRTTLRIPLPRHWPYQLKVYTLIHPRTTRQAKKQRGRYTKR